MIFISWTGLGWLFLLIPCLVLIVCGLMTDVLGRAYLAPLFSVGLVLSAIISWFFGKKINEEKIVAYDEENGEPIIRKNMHTIWSMPVQYLSFILIGLAVLCALAAIFT